MHQILRFAVADGLAVQGRQAGEPFSMGYAIRVVDDDHDPRFELWRRVAGEQPARIGLFDHFPLAQAAAERDYGGEIVERLWRESPSIDHAALWCPPAASLTPEERGRRVVEWDAEMEDAKRDLARYEQNPGDAQKATHMRQRLETIRKLKQEYLAP